MPMPEDIQNLPRKSNNLLHHSSPVFQLIESKRSDTFYKEKKEMGDSSNGKLEESKEIKLHHQSQDDDDNKAVVIEDSKYLVEFIKEIDIGDEDDDTADNNNDSISKEEKSHRVEGSREMVEKKYVSESIVVESIDLNEAVDEPPIESAVSDPKEIKEKPNFENIDESFLERIEGKTSSVLGKSNGLSVEETKLPNESSPIAVIDAAETLRRTEETDLSSTDERKTIEGTGLEHNNNAGASSDKVRDNKYIDSSNAGDHESEKHEILEDTTNPSNVSVTGRPLHPTSWRNCCGIFDVLRRR